MNGDYFPELKKRLNQQGPPIASRVVTNKDSKGKGDEVAAKDYL